MSTSSIDSNVTVPANPAGNAESPNLNAVASGRGWPAIMSLLLGALIILGVGFGPGILHNAAHDTRHTMAFPCH
jgi:cobalt transporter subunit CbtB